MKTIEDKALWGVISEALKNLERDDEIVICSTNENVSIRKIYDAVVSVVPNTTLTETELYGLRSLVLEAIADESFFDWEMPTLTGFSAKDFEDIAKKLPRE